MSTPPESSDEQAAETTEAAETERSRSSTPRPRRRVTPDQSTDDTDRGWGERREESDHEVWLREQRPPHWE